MPELFDKNWSNIATGITNIKLSVFTFVRRLRVNTRVGLVAYSDPDARFVRRASQQFFSRQVFESFRPAGGLVFVLTACHAVNEQRVTYRSGQQNRCLSRHPLSSLASTVRHFRSLAGLHSLLHLTPCCLNRCDQSPRKQARQSFGGHLHTARQRTHHRLLQWFASFCFLKVQRNSATERRRCSELVRWWRKSPHLRLASGLRMAKYHPTL